MLPFPPSTPKTKNVAILTSPPYAPIKKQPSGLRRTSMSPTRTIKKNTFEDIANQNVSERLPNA